LQSKGRSHGHDFHYLLLKSISDDVFWRDRSTDDGPVFDLAQATQTGGAGVLAIREDDGWYSAMSRCGWSRTRPCLTGWIGCLPDHMARSRTALRLPSSRS
jgi:hypothetical protein